MRARESVSRDEVGERRVLHIWSTHKPNLNAKLPKLASGIIIIGIMIVIAGLGHSADSRLSPEGHLDFDVGTAVGIDSHGSSEDIPSQRKLNILKLEDLHAGLEINKYSLLFLAKNAAPEAAYEQKVVIDYQRINRIPEIRFIHIDCDYELEIGTYYGILTHSKVIFWIAGVEPQTFPRKAYTVEGLQAWVEAMFILHQPVHHVKNLRHAIHEISPRKEAALVYFGPPDVSSSERLEAIQLMLQLRELIQTVKFCYSDRLAFGLEPSDDILAIVYVLLDNGTVLQEKIRHQFTRGPVVKALLTARTPWLISLNADPEELLKPQLKFPRLPFLILFYNDMQPSYQEFRNAALHYKNKINFFFCPVRIHDCQTFSKAFGVIQVPMIVMSHPEIDWVRIFFTDLMSTMRIVKFVESTFAELRVALKKRRTQSP